MSSKPDDVDREKTKVREVTALIDGILREFDLCGHFQLFGQYGVNRTAGFTGATWSRMDTKYSSDGIIIKLNLNFGPGPDVRNVASTVVMIGSLANYSERNADCFRKLADAVADVPEFKDMPGGPKSGK